MFILQQTKYTIHESNQKYFENTQINLGLSSTLGSRLRREMEMAWQEGQSQEKRAGVLDIGRAPAGRAPMNSGELRQQRRARECEEMRVSSGRGGREERALSPFYREKEGRGRVGQGEENGRRLQWPSMAIMGKEEMDALNSITQGE
jgi:hypothetical protein